IITEVETKAEPKKKTAAADKPRAPRIKSLEQIECPLCKQGHILKGRAAYGCSRYAEGCSFRLPFDECPADSTPAAVKRKIYPAKKKQ
ncbi:MAG: DNA topoisomerase III, partial [Muribaculaceae bacterium]|nr:DNA topoisomerase III [Muribaculaceae bacterium]